jgi:hypothetical protein
MTAKLIARPFKTAPTDGTLWRVALWDNSFPLRRYFLVRGKRPEILLTDQRAVRIFDTWEAAEKAAVALNALPDDVEG